MLSIGLMSDPLVSYIRWHVLVWEVEERVNFQPWINALFSPHISWIHLWTLWWLNLHFLLWTQEDPEGTRGGWYWGRPHGGEISIFCRTLHFFSHVSILGTSTGVTFLALLCSVWVVDWEQAQLPPGALSWALQKRWFWNGCPDTK